MVDGSYVFHDEYYLDRDSSAKFISQPAQVRVPLNTARAYYRHLSTLLLTIVYDSLSSSEHGSVWCSIEDARNRVYGSWRQLSDDV